MFGVYLINHKNDKISINNIEQRVMILTAERYFALECSCRHFHQIEYLLRVNPVTPKRCQQTQASGQAERDTQNKGVLCS